MRILKARQTLRTLRFVAEMKVYLQRDAVTFHQSQSQRQLLRQRRQTQPPRTDQTEIEMDDHTANESSRVDVSHDGQDKQTAKTPTAVKTRKSFFSLPGKRLSFHAYNQYDEREPTHTSSSSSSLTLPLPSKDPNPRGSTVMIEPTSASMLDGGDLSSQHPPPLFSVSTSAQSHDHHPHPHHPHRRRNMYARPHVDMISADAQRQSSHCSTMQLILQGVQHDDTYDTTTPHPMHPYPDDENPSMPAYKQHHPEEIMTTMTIAAQSMIAAERTALPHVKDDLPQHDPDPYRDGVALSPQTRMKTEVPMSPVSDSGLPSPRRRRIHRHVHRDKYEEEMERREINSIFALFDQDGYSYRCIYDDSIFSTYIGY
jgi:hypothetical protein